MSDNEVWLSPAKINLFLRITAQRQDGMHELQTAFQFIDICDELIFSINKDSSISRATDIPNIPTDNDLSIRAARLLQKHYGVTYGVEIRLNKVIPIGGGLGGASSNAATTLRVLNKLWGINTSQEELAELAVSLGADVPIFIYGFAAWAEGIGEQFSAINPRENFYLIADAGEHVSTAEMFADSQLTRNSPTLTICPPEPGAFGNVFEPIVRARYPKIDRVFNYLNRYSSPFLSGSGGCVVAAFEDENTALRAQSECPEGIATYLVQGRNESPLNSQLLKAEK
ncbi:MAG: 4-(cytidine 5'-diphospho)-2-C-methyl-D-erythritol kinase [Pseudomonadota bacterium]